MTAIGHEGMTMSNRNFKAMRAQFCHVWTMKNGKAVMVQQYIDTFQIRAIVAG